MQILYHCCIISVGYTINGNYRLKLFQYVVNQLIDGLLMYAYNVGTIDWNYFEVFTSTNDFLIYFAK